MNNQLEFSESILGIDEAGRGPVIGPLVIGAVLSRDSVIHTFKEHGVTDSKQLSPQRRESLNSLIRSHAQVVVTKHLSPHRIDQALVAKNDNLNLLEIRAMAGIILNNPANQVILDAVSKPAYFTREIAKILRSSPKITNINQNNTDTLRLHWNSSMTDKSKSDQSIITELVARNKADMDFIVVGAASIIAKVERDRAIKNIEVKYQLQNMLGSGYPNNQLLPFLEQHKTRIQKKYFPFIRYSWKWEPLQRILLRKKRNQAKLFL